MKLDSVKLALASGIISGLAMALLSVYGIYMKLGLRMVSILGGVFPGYAVSWQGAGLGLVYGFVSCFAYMALLGLTYNKLLKVKGISFKKAGKKKRK